MKSLNTYINEKLVLNKDTFKKPSYKYFPKDKKELIKIIDSIVISDYKDDNSKIIDLNVIDTSEITDMSEIFLEYKDYKIDVSNWNTSNVMTMTNMFEYSKISDIIGIENWDVSNVKYMIGMFNHCINIEYLNLSLWNVKKLMFAGVMFDECKNLKSIGDISDWNVKKLLNTTGMFYGCKKLTDIGDLNKWDIINLDTYTRMFENSGVINRPAWYKDKD